MRKFLVFIFSFLSVFANAQVLQLINSYGIEPNRVKPRLYLGIPQGLGSNNIAQAGYDTANIRYNVEDSSLYIQTGSQWLKIGGAGSSPFAENGLTKTGDIIEMGGTWTKNTTITGDYTKYLSIDGLNEFVLAANNISFNGAGQNYMYGDWEVDGLLKGFTDLDINDSAMFHGYGLLDKKFNYSGNIHGTFDGYSLIDKSYFDSVNALNAFAFTVDRGIKQVGDIIRLADTINGAATKFQYVYGKGGAIRAGTVSGTQWDIGNIGSYSAAFGVDTKASGSRAFAAGDGSLASGHSSFAMGDASTATGTSSVAFSGGTASSSYSFAMGLNSSANQVDAMSMGSNTISSAYNSFVTGEYNYANAMNMFVLGQYNDTSGYYLNNPTSKITTNPLFVIGNGTGAGVRSNSLSMLKDGKTYLKNIWYYTTDLSASFTDRSLVDKGYVTGIASAKLSTTLNDGKIYIGSVANVATAQTITGDISLSNTGVSSIGAGVIVNADVNASAAIAVSKLAAVTASKVLVSDASGFISPSSITTTTLGYLDATSSIQTQFDNKVTKGGDVSAFSFGTTGAGQDVTVKLGNNDRWTFDGTNGYLRRGSGTADFGLHLFGVGQGSVIAFGDRFDASTPYVGLREKGGTDTDQMEAFGQKGFYVTTNTYGGTSKLTVQQDGDIILGGETQVAGAELTIIGDEDVSGNSNIQGNLTAGNIILGSASLNFPSTVAGAVSDLTITATGAALNDPVFVGVPNGSVTTTATYWAWVSSANTVTVRFSPKATEDPASGTFKIKVFK